MQFHCFKIGMAITLIAFLGTCAIPLVARADVVGGRPPGCPHRYCGCASAKYVGLPNDDGRWNLARKWLGFPRAAPGPGWRWSAAVTLPLLLEEGREHGSCTTRTLEAV